jgi:7,8-dihydropterin-6-yl-methyl-4-(beta-D-ribofuranosyl)aminobenzene 5'-phosphate synthase
MNKLLALVIVAVVILCVGFALSRLEMHKADKGNFSVPVEPKIRSSPSEENLSITVVYDNNRYNDNLTTAWGFSCFVNGTEQTILFDTGGDGSLLLSNMEKLGIKPEDVDVVVLSHIHGDHVGGIVNLLETNPDLTVYLPQSFPTEFKAEVRLLGAEVVEVQEPLRICDEVYSTGELGTPIKEQSLIVHTEKGLIVITGCAHPGIVNILTKVQASFQDDLLFVMGGFHLSGAGKSQIEGIVTSFKNLEVQYVGPCHCSGETARQMFAEEYQEKFINIGVGKVITMADLN